MIYDIYLSVHVEDLRDLSLTLYDVLVEVGERPLHDVDTGLSEHAVHHLRDLQHSNQIVTLYRQLNQLLEDTLILLRLIIEVVTWCEI